MDASWLQKILDEDKDGYAFAWAVVKGRKRDPTVTGRVIVHRLLKRGLPVDVLLDFLPLVDAKVGGEDVPFPGVWVMAGNEVMNKLLRTAVRLNHVSAVKWLLKAKADPEALCENSILNAISKGFKEIVTSILDEYSAMPARLLCRMLVCACASGNLELAKALIEKGADANEGDELDLPLPLACKRKPFDIPLARLLLDNGADVNKPRPDDGLVGSDLVLHRACETNRLVVALFLLDNGADPELRDREGNAALHHAAIAGNVQIAGLLLDRGADICAKVRYGGYEAVHLAAQNKQWDMCKFLMAKGSATVELPKLSTVHLYL